MITLPTVIDEACTRWPLYLSPTPYTKFSFATPVLLPTISVESVADQTIFSIHIPGHKLWERTRAQPHRLEHPARSSVFRK